MQSILAAFDSPPLEEIAKIGDSIIFNSPKQTPDTVSSQGSMSMLLQEMSTIKIELASLKQNFANTSTSKLPCHRALPSLPHTSARPPRSTQHHLSFSCISTNSNYNHSQQTPPFGSSERTKRVQDSRDGLVKLDWVHCLQYTVNCFQYNVCDLCRCESSNHYPLLFCPLTPLSKKI